MMSLKDGLKSLIERIRAFVADLPAKLGRLYRRVDTLSGGTLTIIGNAVGHFGMALAGESAAAMAYSAFFSLFPLLLSAVAAAGYLLENNQTAYQQIIGAIIRAFPGSRALIRQNIQQVLELRGTVGIIGLITLIVSARGIFGVLASAIDRAWPEAEPRDFLEMQLVALGMEGTLFVFLGLWLGSTAALKVLPDLRKALSIKTTVIESPFWTVAANFVPWLFISVMFFALYWWVPNVEVPWWAAARGAMVTATAWEVATAAFTWYLGSGLVQYQLVYGSLGTVAILLIWIYYGSVITLFGAHLTAAIVRHAEAPEGDEG
jgi:membrane protein